MEYVLRGLLGLSLVLGLGLFGCSDEPTTSQAAVDSAASIDGTLADSNPSDNNPSDSNPSDNNTPDSTTPDNTTGVPDSDATVALSQYKPQGKAFKLSNIAKNLSGITYNWDTQSYLLIRNGKAVIYEYDTSFQPLRTITLNLLGTDKDTEGIAYLGNSELVIVNESNHAFIVKLTASQTSIISKVQDFTLPPYGTYNKGLEGICYDRQAKIFYAVQESSPRRFFRFQRPADTKDATYKSDLSVTEPINGEAFFNDKASDLSGCVFDQSTGHVIVSSHESSKLIEVDLSTQKIVDQLILDGAPQYEGVTRGANGTIVVVSEPNWVRIYSP